MKSSILKSIHGVALVFVLTLAGVAFTQGVKAQKPESQAKQLDGTWRVQVTIRVCQTGAEIFSFPALVTFAQGGTMTETNAGPGPTLRSPGHGVWQHTGGNTYSQLFELFLFDPAGAWTGKQKVTQTVEIGRNRDEITSSGTAEIFNTNGTLLFMGCSTAVGHRME
jgi:hypothetical protein